MSRSLRVTRSHLSLFVALAVTAAGCSSSSEEATSESAVAKLEPAACAAAPEWAPNVAYATGSAVRYEGKVYKVIQGHTSLEGWTPAIVPALFEPTDCAPGTPDPGNPGTPDPGNPGTPDPGNPGTPDPGNPGTPDPGTGDGKTEYAPYFYTWGWGNAAYPFTSLVDMKAKSGLDGVTLAFVIAAGNSCALSNDGTTNIIETQMMADIQAFRSSGGKIKASFGGATGTYLEVACGSASALEAALEGFVTRTGISDLDFDVEQWQAMSPEINKKRAEAFKSLQTKHPEVQVSFTLPVMPSGLVEVGYDNAAGVVRDTAQAGVRVKHVNLMTMDYGNVQGAMGDLAIQALTSVHGQLKNIFASASDAQLWSMLGATPMIGQNDTAGEVFSLADARNLTSFAKQKGIGLVSFWAINRDQPGAGLALSSGVNTAPFEFHNVFKAVK